jgi:hypothetical protein
MRSRATLFVFKKQSVRPLTFNTSKISAHLPLMLLNSSPLLVIRVEPLSFRRAVDLWGRLNSRMNLL